MQVFLAYFKLPFIMNLFKFFDCLTCQLISCTVNRNTLAPKKRSPVKRKNLARESEKNTANAVNTNTSSTCDLVTAVVDGESAGLPLSTNVNEQLSEEQISVEELQGIIRDKNMEIE